MGFSDDGEESNLEAENAVTMADFIHELSERLLPLLNSYIMSKLVEHSMTLANVCLICKLLCIVFYLRYRVCALVAVFKIIIS